MNVRRLEQINFSVLMECFLKAFENYFVKMPTDHEYYKERWYMANVRLDLSYGMFKNGKLIGFIINAVDERNGNLIAFNTGTGVLPEYRGQRIVSSIYEYAIPDLKRHGITKCRLEVIKDNFIAIKVYEKIGFKITKNYKCYNGSIALEEIPKNLELKQVDVSFFDWSTLHQDHFSWDNHFKVITKGDYQYYVIYEEDTWISYFIINPKNGYVAQFDVLNNVSNNWNKLFQGIRSISETVKINNVEERLIEKNYFLKSINLNNTVDQYEMEFDLF